MRNPHLLSAAAITVAFVVASSACAEAAGDAAHGEQVFAKCAPCHSKGNTAGLGPGLLGVIGRHAGSMSGFRYSRAMKTSNIVWDEKALDAFVTAPQKAVPGTTMPFAGLQDPQERTDLIAYLETFK
jgi:cytochrome c